MQLQWLFRNHTVKSRFFALAYLADTGYGVESGYVQIITDPDPEGRKTPGSNGPRKLKDSWIERIRNIETTVKSSKHLETALVRVAKFTKYCTVDATRII